MSNDLKAKGISSFIWDIVGKLANGGMGFILTIFLARLLEPSDFGLIAIVLVFLGFMSIFFDAGLASALIQRKRVLPIHYSSVFYFNLIISAVLILLVCVFSRGIASFYDNQKLISLIQVMSISFMLGALSSVQKVQLQKELNYKLLSKITIVSTVMSGVIGILLAYYGAGVWSLVAQNLSLGIITNILLWKTSQWRPSFIFSIKALKSLWRFGFNVFIVSIMNGFFGRIDVLVAGKIVSPSVLGFYDRAKHLNQMIYSYTAGSLISILFPVLSKVHKDLPRFQSIFIKIYAILGFGVFLLIGSFYLISHELIILLFSEKWLVSVEYFKIIVLSVFAPVFGALLTNVLISRGKSKRYLNIDIYKKILMMANLYIGFLFGLEGYLYGYILVSFFVFIIDLYYATEELHLPIYSFMKTVLIQALIAIVSVYVIHNVSMSIDCHYIVMLFGKLFSFVLLYSVLSWLYKTNAWLYTVEELFQIMKKVKER